MPAKPDKPRLVVFPRTVNTPGQLYAQGKPLTAEEAQAVCKVPQRVFPAATPIQLTDKQIQTHGLREGVDFHFVNDRGVNKKPKR